MMPLSVVVPSGTLIYPGNGAAIRFLPAHDNGESFAGFTASRFHLGTIAVTNATALAPKSTHGIGVRISMPALGLGLANGNGLFDASAANNLVLAGTISTGGGSLYLNQAESQTNVVVDTRPLTASAIAVTASPFVYQNRNMKPTMVTITSGRVSAIETSVDGTDWIGVATSTDHNLTLKPGQWVRVTYSALPRMKQIY